jgi:hypothetical protein
VLAVYVFGIVVEAAMYELIELFRDVESIVSAPPTLVSPDPSSDVNVEPFSMKFVVEAVVNDPYVVDENANLFTPEKKLVSDSSVDEADDPETPPETQTPFTAKHPLVRLIPFANVDEAVADVTFSRLVCIPPWNVEVAVEVDMNEFATTTPPTESF